MDFPGWPSNDYDFQEEDLGNSFAGFFARDVNGAPREGVLPSSDTLVTASTGWTVSVKPFAALRRKVGTQALVGGNSSVLSVTTPGAPAANARIDVIYGRVSDMGAGDPVESVGIAVGTPGAVPSKPILPSGTFEIATIRTSAGNTSIAQATITNTFTYTCAAGGTLTVRTIAERDAWDVAWGGRVYCLADGIEYVRKQSGGWQRSSPVPPAVPKIARGTLAFTGLGMGTAKQMAVSLASAGFTQAPTVQLTSGTGIAIETALAFWVSGAPSKDGFNVNLAKSNGVNHTIYWTAIGT